MRYFHAANILQFPLIDPKKFYSVNLEHVPVYCSAFSKTLTPPPKIDESTKNLLQKSVFIESTKMLPAEVQEEEEEEEEECLLNKGVNTVLLNHIKYRI